MPPEDSAAIAARPGKFVAPPPVRLNAILGGKPENADEPLAAMLRRLRDADRLVAALRLAAHALPGREAVWWGAMCIEAALPPDRLPEGGMAALEAAKAWVWQPEDDALGRKACAASRACHGTPPGLLGLAIGFNRRLGGNRGFGAGVEAAVLGLAPARDEPARLAAWRRAFIDSALDIGAGGAGRIAGGACA